MKECLVLLWQVAVFSSKQVNMFSRILWITALMFSIVLNSVASLTLAETWLGSIVHFLEGGSDGQTFVFMSYWKTGQTFFFSFAKIIEKVLMKTKHRPLGKRT
jgi:nucleoside permease NupC